MILNKNVINDQGAFFITAKDDDYGKRLDLFISENIDSCHRTQASGLIKNQHVFVNSTIKKTAYKIKPGDCISGHIPPVEPITFKPEKIPLNILFEDKDIIIINKQPGIVVHPAPGNWSGTLVNGLLFHCPDIQSGNEENRPGIVHRLDKNTSGVMVVAKNRKSLFKLSESFQSREVKKEYLAIVHGVLKIEKGIIDLPVGRHPIERKKMSTISPKGKYAETHFKVEKRFLDSTLLRCVIKTGRTHQIRVHCQSMGHPIVGDDVYTNRRGNHNKISSISRQMLHSSFLEFNHPVTLEPLTFVAPMPEDMLELIRKLECLLQSHATK